MGIQLRETREETMSRFKKGDWVVISKFNNYPVKLEEDEVYTLPEHAPLGVMDPFGTNPDLDKMFMPVAVRCIRDPRQVVYNCKGSGYVEFYYVKFAADQDMDLLYKEYALNLRRARKEFNEFVSEMVKAGFTVPSRPVNKSKPKRLLGKKKKK